MIGTLGAFGLGLGESAELVSVSAYDYDLLLVLSELGDDLVSLVARVAAFCAGHEDLLLLLLREESGTALGTKLHFLIKTVETG